MRATAFSPPGMRAGSDDAGASLEADQRRGPGPRWRDGQSWPLITAVLFAVGGLCALAEGPLWNHATALAGVNLAVSLLFVFTGLRLRGEPGQRGVAYALMLAGVLRSFDFIDAWNESPLGFIRWYSAAWTACSAPGHCCVIPTIPCSGTSGSISSC